MSTTAAPSGESSLSLVYTDKAYKRQRHDALLRERGLKNGIQYKAVRNQKLTDRQLEFNRLVSSLRYTIERTFGGQKSWLGAGTARYVGLAKPHARHVMEAIAYNLKRLPKLYVDSEIEKLRTSLEGQVCP